MYGIGKHGLVRQLPGWDYLHDNNNLIYLYNNTLLVCNLLYFSLFYLVPSYY